MPVLIFLSLQLKIFMMFELLTKVYRVYSLIWGWKENKTCFITTNSKVGGCLRVSQPSVLCVIINIVQDNPFKRNRGFVVGTRVEIWGVSSDKSGSAACIKSPAWQKLLSASPSVLRLLQCVFFWPLSRTRFYTDMPNFHSRSWEFMWQTV